MSYKEWGNLDKLNHTGHFSTEAAWSSWVSDSNPAPFLSNSYTLALMVPLKTAGAGYLEDHAWLTPAMSCASAALGQKARGGFNLRARSHEQAPWSSWNIQSWKICRELGVRRHMQTLQTSPKMLFFWLRNTYETIPLPALC